MSVETRGIVSTVGFRRPSEAVRVVLAGLNQTLQRHNLETDLVYIM